MKKFAYLLALVLALAIPAVAVAEMEEWEYEEPDYMEITAVEGERFTAAGYLSPEERGWNSWTGKESDDLVCFFYPDQPLDITVMWGEDHSSAVMLEKLQVIVSGEYNPYSGERVVVSGVFAFADEVNQYASAVALVDAAVTVETDSEVFLPEVFGQIEIQEMPAQDIEPIAASDWTASAVSDAAYVYADGGKSNMRKGPGLDYKILCTFKKGDTAEYLGSSKWDERGVEWYNISYNGYTGWVSSKYTTLMNGTSGGEGSGAVSAGYVYADGGKSNMRKGPGLDYKIYCTFKEGDYAVFLNETQVDERGVAWYRIAYREYDGWVSSKYTSLIYYGQTYYQSVEATANVFARLGPGLNYGICDVLKPGDTRDYLGDTYYDDRGVAWYRVSCKNGVGWVSSRYAALIGG